MALAIACTPAAPAAKSSACRIDVTGATIADTSTYDTGQYPTEDAFRYHLAFVLDGLVKARSYDFETDANGDHAFNSFIFESAGSWTIELRKADESVAGSQAVTVS